jgi:tRNA uridine 5-carboxymethylaminomethyl modification enzyme
LIGLRTEACEKLAHVRPATVGQATRLAGVNPADISVLLVHLRKLESKPKGSNGSHPASRPDSQGEA